MDAKLRPIAKGPLIEPRSVVGAQELRDVVDRAVQLDSPLERAGIRPEADALVEALVEFYASAADEERAAIRGLFRTYDSFAWAAGWGLVPRNERLTEERFRQALVLFSIKDQGIDWRDAIVSLDALCARALRFGLPLAETLAEVAVLSSDESRFLGFKSARSTRAMLRDYAARFRNGAGESSSA